jgi:hypothetical protein
MCTGKGAPKKQYPNGQVTILLDVSVHFFGACSPVGTEISSAITESGDCPQQLVWLDGLYIDGLTNHFVLASAQGFCSHLLEPKRSPPLMYLCLVG